MGVCHDLSGSRAAAKTQEMYSRNRHLRGKSLLHFSGGLIRVQSAQRMPRAAARSASSLIKSPPPDGRTMTTMDRKLPSGERTTRRACILAGIEKERPLGKLVKAPITRLTDAQRAGRSSAPRRIGRSTVPTRPRHSCLEGRGDGPPSGDAAGPSLRAVSWD